MCPTMWFYLAEIFRIEDEHPMATLSMLADGMEVSLQAASRMVRRMVEMGMVVHEPYKGVTLTDKGREIALMMLRRHRVLEVYLVTCMGFGWDEVHDMTSTLERGINDKLVDRMYELAGEPVRCPHGEPIPSADGVMPEVNDKPLTDWPEDEPGQVSRVKTHEEERLQYLAKVNLVPGTPVVVTGKSPLNGPIHIACGDERLVLGYEMSTQILIEEPTAN